MKISDYADGGGDHLWPCACIWSYRVGEVAAKVFHCSCNWIWSIKVCARVLSKKMLYYRKYPTKTRAGFGRTDPMLPSELLTAASDLPGPAWVDTGQIGNGIWHQTKVNWRDSSDNPPNKQKSTKEIRLITHPVLFIWDSLGLESEDWYPWSSCCCPTYWPSWNDIFSFI